MPRSNRGGGGEAVRGQFASVQASLQRGAALAATTQVVAADAAADAAGAGSAKKTVRFETASRAPEAGAGEAAGG